MCLGKLLRSYGTEASSMQPENVLKTGCCGPSFMETKECPNKERQTSEEGDEEDGD